MTLRTKLTLLLSGVFLALGAAVLSIELSLMNRLMLRDAEDRMKQAIKTGWSVLEAQRERAELTVAMLAETGIKLGGDGGGGDGGDGMLARAAHTAGLGALVLLDGQGRVTHASFAAPQGMRLDLPAASSGYAVLDAPASVLGHAGAVLALYAGVQVEGGRLLALDVLDGREELVDRIQDALFAPTRVDGRPFGTVTIFRGVERVATTVTLPDGRRAVGTQAEERVTNRVLQAGTSWSGRARVLNDWYISRYEPIRNPAGQPIGMLYVGELERAFLAERRRVLTESLALLLAITLAASFVAVVFGRRMLRQIAEVHAAASRMKAGEPGVRSAVHSRDELGLLAQEFNAMAAELECQRTALTEQNERLEAARRSYLETVGFVAHELRNNLGTALFNAEAMREGTYGPLEPGPQEGLSLVCHSLAYMNELMANYLQLQRIERGELLMKKVPVALARDVIRPAAGSLESLMSERQMRLEVSVAEDIDVVADPSLLRVVYENLFGNAVKYGAQGGLIRASAQRQGERVRLEVWNEGPGLSPERVGLLFRKFQHFDAAGPHGRRGAGLGLYIVQQIITHHGGEVSAASEQGHWLSVAFTLQLSGPPAL